MSGKAVCFSHCVHFPKHSEKYTALDITWKWTSWLRSVFVSIRLRFFRQLLIPSSYGFRLKQTHTLLSHLMRQSYCAWSTCRFQGSWTHGLLHVCPIPWLRNRCHGLTSTRHHNNSRNNLCSCGNQTHHCLKHTHGTN